MKRFLAVMAMLFVSVMAVWVAFRLAPETWAMIAGIIFGLVAALPMGAIVIILLLRGHGEPRRPAEPAYYPPPQPVVLLQPGPAGYAQLGGYAADPRTARQLPPGAPYPARRAAPARPPRAFVDHTQVSYEYAPAPAPAWVDAESYDVEDATGWEDGPAEAYGAWERPEPPAPRGARILGR